MKCRTLVVGGLVAALAIAPVSSAWAWRDRDRWYGSPLFWPFAVAGAVVLGAAELVTLPFRAVAAAVSYPGPGYYYPGPGYYAPPPAYYYPPPQAYYYPPQGYYQPRPGYYAPPQQGYYPPPQGATVTPR